MRIISGNLKGSKLYITKGNAIRPLKDLARESIFNLLTHSNKISFLYHSKLLIKVWLIENKAPESGASAAEKMRSAPPQCWLCLVGMLSGPQSNQIKTIPTTWSRSQKIVFFQPISCVFMLSKSVPEGSLSIEIR